MTTPNERTQPGGAGFEVQSQRVADCEADCTAAPELRKRTLAALRAEALFNWLTIAVAAALIAYKVLRFAWPAP